MRKINISKEEIEGLYVNQKLSTTEIAKKFGVSHQTILNRMKEYNIQSRTISESLGFEKVRKKISEALKGEKHPFYNKHLSEEIRKKISEGRWKGGLKVAWLRKLSKRRQLGFKPLNKPFDNSEAHHLQDKETVIYIPKELHRRIYHNNWTGKNMNIVDALALDYLELQILGEVV
jgi:predicted DNA-binding protein YlxM (UPF0122 family)